MDSRLLYCFIGLMLFSCQQALKTESENPSEIKVVEPQRVGLSPDTLQEIDLLIQQQIDSQFIAGGVALVAREDQIAYYKAFGYRDNEKTDSLEADDIFRIASMTKAITSTAIMQLYEEGELDVNDPVSKYIPGFSNPVVVESINAEDSTYITRPANREITIHDLLTHTSGLAYGSFIKKAGIVYEEFEPVEAWTSDSVLLADNAKVMAQLPLLHDPGAKFTYGISIDVLGRVVEVVSGMPLDQYFYENIFEPLSMNDTHFYLPDADHDRLVDVWSSDGELEGGLNVEQADYPINGAETYFSGGAGLSSTILDYYKFLRAIINGGAWEDTRILKSETVAMMSSNQIDTLFVHDNEQFGYGFSVYTGPGPNGIKEGRYGWGGYWHTHFWIDPSRDVIGLIYTNAYSTPGWNELREGFERVVNNAVVE